MSDSGGYRAFRQRLDAVLRRRDPAALREFLVAEGQWDAEARTDVEAAMWMMIATSPALADMRDDARRWLMEHGHAAEAAAIFGRQGGDGQRQRDSGQQRRGPEGTPGDRGGGHGRQARRPEGKRPESGQRRRPSAPQHPDGPKHPHNRPPRGPDQRGG